MSIDRIYRTKERKIIADACDNCERFQSLTKEYKNKIVNLIESGILSESIRKAKSLSILTIWDNSEFVEIYSNIGYGVAVNLDVNSSINRHQPEPISHYLINRVINFVLFAADDLPIAINVDKDKINKVADEVSKPIFTDDINKTVDEVFKPIFTNKINLDDNNNAGPSEMERINPKILGKMTSLELNPHINRVIVEELKTRGEQEIKLKYSTMHKCDTCGAKKTKEREIQTRSLDEGKTLFIECMQCGSTWRKYG
jgi:DNA-directed RNA polymerase subunit M/transcription elongation factor TFIIS